jgi:hypothetical protein
MLDKSEINDIVLSQAHGMMDGLAKFKNTA